MIKELIIYIEELKNKLALAKAEYKKAQGLRDCGVRASYYKGRIEILEQVIAKLEKLKPTSKESLEQFNYIYEVTYRYQDKPSKLNLIETCTLYVNHIIENKNDFKSMTDKIAVNKGVDKVEVVHYELIKEKENEDEADN